MIFCENQLIPFTETRNYVQRVVENYIVYQQVFINIAIKNKTNISIIKEQSLVPVIVDAGIGTSSDATIAMELGCDGVLVNTAIAKAKKPYDMALAFKNAVIAGR